MTDRPNDIPQDVWDKAAAVGEAIHGRHERGFILWPLISEAGPAPQEIVARAILSARPAAVEDGPGEPDPLRLALEEIASTKISLSATGNPTGLFTLLNSYVKLAQTALRIAPPSPTEGEAR